ncbi:hypothetical protein PHMEG_00030205, partial [Phytophthora megakarya]
WSESDAIRPQPKRRRGSTDAPLSVPSWPGSDESIRVWGGPIPDVVGTSSLASGDAPTLTPDENMSSTGGGSQGFPGVEPSTAMVGVYTATTGSGTGPSNVAEQPAFYVPVAEYPPDQDTRLPPRAPTPTSPMTRWSDPDGLDEETKSDDPMVDQRTRLSETGRDQDQDLRDANRQISELRAAMSRNGSDMRTIVQPGPPKQPKRRSPERNGKYQDGATREAEKKKAADQEFASLQAKLYLLEKERARERESDSQFRAEASRRMEEVSEQCNQAISRATVAIEETKIQADEDLLQIKREMKYQSG